ncbi:Eaa1 [Klebsiella pneumoniae]|nr:Eaa1 [Klebsiella pneumoniae]SVZ58948.1 Eaa1 [Klebsiella pneumoniae]SWA11853.1 Eaa1 [Klebsiella pneumoniae]SWA15531.1 Eaa1 [Klebsiella pneumoniae]VUH73155.1 Eaa1 [Klebsiella pneumoniae]
MINNQLTEKRARLRKAAQDYQSSLSWYQENLDSPNAEQDCDESSAAFKREIGYREMDIIADLLDEIDELQERGKADREPVVKKVACWSCQNEVEISAIGDCDGCSPKCGTRIHLDEEPYIAPLSAPDRDQVRREHAEWSQATFGNVGPVGPLKHLSKEALEAAAEPGDLSEWADMQFLLWDAQRRAGITDEQITQAMIEKLAVNKQRSWPEPKDGEPRLHINEQPALTGNFPIIGIDQASGPDRTVEVSYVAPPGYVMVPMRLTAENGAKGALSGEFSETKFVNCSECFGDDECETCDGSGRIEITVPVSWTTIKEIWAKGVEHFAAALQEVK